jgi:membrane carboxypeptidase/penicillin-binding protein
MDAALRRRNYALGAWPPSGYITEEEAEAARQRPSSRRRAHRERRRMPPYFVEEVRKYLEQVRRQADLRERPVVQTALDVKLQEAANARARRGLRRIDRRAAWRARRGTSSTRAGRSRRSGCALDPADAPGDVVPAVVTGRSRRAVIRCAPAATDHRPRGLRLDAPDIGGRSS